MIHADEVDKDRAAKDVDKDMERTYDYSIAVIGDKEWMHVKDIVISPCCGEKMRFDHFRSRVYIRDYTKHNLMIEVHRCPKCGRQHSVLPDFLVTYKRYTVDAICQIVKEPKAKAQAEPSTKLRMVRWLERFLALAGDRMDNFEKKSVSDCTAAELSARLSAAFREGIWFPREYEQEYEEAG